jgi:SprT protein
VEAREKQRQRNAEILRKYVPERCVEKVAEWIVDYDFKLKIKPERNSVLGDYMSPRDGKNHVITVNHNLNPYAFFITLVHEVAHLVTYNRYGNRVSAHGREWKGHFRELMQPFLNPEIFPLDVFSALRGYMQDPAATSCGDPALLKTLKLYDAQSDMVFLEYLPQNALFLYNGKRLFRKGEKIRKRFKCYEQPGGHIYLFHALAEVKLFEDQNLTGKLFGT